MPCREKKLGSIGMSASVQAFRPQASASQWNTGPLWITLPCGSGSSSWPTTLSSGAVEADLSTLPSISTTTAAAV